VGGLRGGGGGFPRDNFEGGPPVGESVLAGMAGTGRDSEDGFTGELVRAGIGGDGRDGGAVGSPNGWEEGIYEAVEEAVSNLLQCCHLELVSEPA
jgi:hypothetical protein